MTKRKAEKLTGCEIRLLEPSRAGLVCVGAFECDRLAAQAESRYEETALEALVKTVYDRNSREALKRSGWRCARCRCSAGLQIHHRTYRAHGGTHEVQNLEPLCWKCHHLIHKYEGSAGYTR